ncbi:uncharacterized protein METZ01_LOCUS268480, partial [marine metagenome]
VVPHPRKFVWNAFDDTELLVSCFPGAKLILVEGDGTFSGEVSARLGPMRMQFSGDGLIIRDQSSWQGEVKGKGSDRGSNSRVTANMRYQLTEEGQGQETLIKVEVDYALTGSLAQVGRGPVLEEFVRQITKEFGATLDQKLQRSVVNEIDVRSTAAGQEELLFGSIFLKALCSIVRKGLARLFVK